MANYLESVAIICGVNSEEITGLSQRRLVEDLILPRALKESGQDTRGWRISPQFMQFMAYWGQKCVNIDRESGELLMEIALQRLSCGAVIFKEKYNILQALPEEYRKYSVCYDQPGLMDESCMTFLYRNLYFCMKNLHNATWRYHAELICKGLLQNIACNGELLNGYLWGQNRKLSYAPLDAYNLAESVAKEVWGIQKVAAILLPSWRDHKDFFRKNEIHIDFGNLFEDNWSGVNLNYDEEAEKLFGTKKAKVLRFFHLTRCRVKDEIIYNILMIPKPVW